MRLPWPWRRKPKQDEALGPVEWHYMVHRECPDPARCHCTCEICQVEWQIAGYPEQDGDVPSVHIALGKADRLRWKRQLAPAITNLDEGFPKA